MPITPINFAGIEPIGDYGNSDIFSNILKMRKSYDAATKRNQEEEKQGHQNTIWGEQAKNAPEMEKAKVDEIHGKNSHQNLLNALKQIYGAKEIEATIEEKKAHAHHLRETANGSYDPSKQGEGVEGSLYKLPKNAQVDIIKDMRNDVRKMDDLLQVNKELNQFREINKKFPKMNESFQAILLNGGENPGLIHQLIKQLSLNPKEYEALTQAQKIANSIALRMAATMGGGKRWTDYMAKMVQSIKPSPLHPSPTNDIIIDNILKENSFAEEHRKKLLQGLKKGFPVWPDYETGRAHPEEALPNALPQSKGASNGMVKIRFKGAEYNIPADKAEEYLRQEGAELVK